MVAHSRSLPVQWFPLWVSFIHSIRYNDALFTLTRSRLHRSPCTLFWTLLYPTDGVCLSRVHGPVVVPAGVATIAPTQAWVLGIDSANTSYHFSHTFSSVRLSVQLAGRNEELPQSPGWDESGFHPLVSGDVSYVYVHYADYVSDNYC